jgi:ankyrin repeat protein
MSTQELNDALLAAAEKRDAAAVRALLARGADVNAKKHPGGDTALEIASMAGDVETTEVLLDNGVDTEAKLGLGMTTLMQAGIRTLNLLLAKGANVNAKDDKGKTVLMWAIDPQLSGSIEKVQALLEKGADVAAKDNDGKTPLMWALSGHNTSGTFNPATIHLLLEKGADVNARDNRGQTVLMLAVSFWATARFSVESLFSPMVKELIARGADVNAKDPDGKTVLMKAQKNPKIVRLLKKHGAQV